MCLTCGARARSVVTFGVVRTRHGRSVEVGLTGGITIVVESSGTCREDGDLRVL